MAQRRQSLSEWQRRLFDQTRQELRRKQNLLANLQPRLHLLGPENVLARGYSITTDAATGAVIRAASETRPGQPLTTKLKLGEVRSVVER